MVSNSRLTDEQSLPNLPVLESLGDERNYLSFSLSERVDLRQLGINLFLVPNRHLAQHAAHRRSIKPNFPSMDFLNCLDQHIGRVFFENYAHCTELHCLAMCICIAQTGQDEDASVGCCLT